MHRADGTLSKVRIICNGLKPVVIKIFQPFFTTKPTGQGRGLGLSLSYDIIKAHGGQIKVEKPAGQAETEFIITLPSGP
ncbi:MAG: ATP-binding protein [Chitinophagaceae bacterium]